MEDNKEFEGASAENGTFYSIIDEDGKEIYLDYVETVLYNGVTYMAFYPMMEDGQEEEDEDSGLIILKEIEEDGEKLLSTLDTDEELNTVYELFVEALFDDDEDEE